MQVRSKLYLTSGWHPENEPGTHWIGCCVDLRACLAVWRREISLDFCGIQTQYHPVRSLVTTSTELSRIILIKYRRHFTLSRVRKIAKSDYLASSCLSVRLSAWKKSASTGRILMTVDVLGFWEKVSWDIRFGQNLSRITGTSWEELCNFMIKCVGNHLNV